MLLTHEGTALSGAPSVISGTHTVNYVPFKPKPSLDTSGTLLRCMCVCVSACVLLREVNTLSLLKPAETELSSGPLSATPESISTYVLLIWSEDLILVVTLDENDYCREPELHLYCCFSTRTYPTQLDPAQFGGFSTPGSRAQEVPSKVPTWMGFQACRRGPVMFIVSPSLVHEVGN